MQREIEAEDRAVRESQRAPSQGGGVSSASSDPFAKVEERTNEQVGRATKQIASAQEDLDNAQAINKEERAILRQAKTLVEEGGSEEKIKKLEERFNKLQEKRAALNEEVEQKNRARVEEGKTVISQGNRGFGGFGPDKVEVDAKREVDFSSKASIAKGLKAVRSEARSLRRQEEGLREEQAAVDAVSSKSKEDLDEIRKNTKSGGDTKIVQGGDNGTASALEAYNSARSITAQTLLGRA